MQKGVQNHKLPSALHQPRLGKFASVGNSNLGFKRAKGKGRGKKAWAGAARGKKSGGKYRGKYKRACRGRTQHAEMAGKTEGQIRKAAQKDARTKAGRKERRRGEGQTKVAESLTS